jgi:hypothetical protein
MRPTLHRTARRLAAGAAAVLLSTAALTVVTESPALAVSCAGPSHRPNGGGGFNIAETTTLWTGPYSVCNKVGSLNTQQLLWAWCFWLNDYGNTWWYVRVGGTSTYGWVYPANGTVAYFSTYISSGDYESPVACS